MHGKFLLSSDGQGGKIEPAAGMMPLLVLEGDGSALVYVDQEAVMRQHHCCYPRQHEPKNPVSQFPFHPLPFVLRKSALVLWWKGDLTWTVNLR